MDYMDYKAGVTFQDRLSMERIIQVLKSRFPRMVGIVKRVRIVQRVRNHIAKKHALLHRFTRIYETNSWGDAESRSGEGSSLIQTAVIRTELPKWLAELQVKSLLDVPCGDHYWMSKTNLPVERYIGADIVPDLITRNAAQYGGPGKDFIILDITKNRLPRVDCIFCRDCLDHLSISHIFKALANIQLSGSTYFITTVYTDLTKNEDIETGDWRPTNLTLPPFNFPSPLKLLNEGSKEEKGGIWPDKSLALWRIADLQAIQGECGD
jgi:hypothetical protein